MDEADGSFLDGDVSLRDAINLATPNDTINALPHFGNRITVLT
jgi:hypothetical protein